MIQTSDSYVHGTAAEQLQYNVYEENNVLKQKKNQRANAKVKLKIVFALLLFFSAVFILIYRYALITDINYKINTATVKYNEVASLNNRLKVEIEKNTDLTRIKEEAEKRLGMHKPDKYQIVSVKLPRTDHTEIAGQENEQGSKPENKLALLMERIGKLVHLLY